MTLKTSLSILFSMLVAAGFCQNTVGLIDINSENTNGYVLFSPMTSTETYLIDKCGEKVHEWNTSSFEPALSGTLLEDGSLLRSGQLDNPSFNEGGSGGIIEHFNWDGSLLWSYTLSDSLNCLHHDFKVMPNGNILCIVWDSYTKNQAVLNGKDSTYNQSYLWSEKIIEIKPLGTDSAEVVWEWKLVDHMIQEYDNTKLDFGVIQDHPELVDINYFPGVQNTPDWIHLNSIDYNPELDQIMVSAHRMCEVWIIDHSTTTLEASTHNGGDSGKGGDLLYRWGNPQAYQRGNPTTKIFFGQHHATWIPPGFPNEGKILVFNNGLGRPGDYSSIDIISPPLNASNNYDVPLSTSFLPSSLDWSYTAINPSDFYSSNISGVYPIENGSFLISSGANGLFFEIDSGLETNWEYINPVGASGISFQGDVPTGNPVFRASFYNQDYAGLQGRILIPSGEIEQNPSQPALCESLLGLSDSSPFSVELNVTPNPFNNQVKIQSVGDQTLFFTLYDPLGRIVFSADFINELNVVTSTNPSGMYYYEINNHQNIIKTGKLIKQ